MTAPKILSVPIGLIILLLGWLQPQLVVIDMPFGLAVYIADRLGKWHQGLLWAPNHRVLAVTCFIIWPVIVSWLFAYGIVCITSKLWFGGTKRSRLLAVLFVVLVFGITLSVRVEPGSYFVSYFGYSTANY